jgi:hypothetical protein
MVKPSTSQYHATLRATSATVSDASMLCAANGTRD